jgi:hypothetical protein
MSNVLFMHFSFTILKGTGSGMTSNRKFMGSIPTQQWILLVTGAIYLAMFISYSFHRHFFCYFYLGYLNFTKQEHWILSLCHVGEQRFTLEYLWHILTVQKLICNGNYSDLSIAKIKNSKLNYRLAIYTK